MLRRSHAVIYHYGVGSTYVTFTAHPFEGYFSRPRRETRHDHRGAG
jgi:hypothetical protein